MWIVKLGGSWISNPNLRKLITNLYFYRSVPLLIVPGGGKFVDAIRYAHKYIQFEEQLAHQLSVKSTEIYAKILKNISPYDVKFIRNISKLDTKKRLNIFLSYNQLLKDRSIPKTWNTTSDTIACWLGKKIKCTGILFIKSISYENMKKLDIFDLQKSGILDKNVHNYISESIKLKLAGPEIVEKLSRKNGWDKLMSSLTEIKWKRKKK